MILKPLETMLAYRCPKCGECVISPVGSFSLAGDMYKLKCSCGGSEAVLSMTSDDRVRLIVPCIICPNPHNFTVSKKVFFGRELFILECPYSGVAICFTGNAAAIKRAFDGSTKELIEMAGLDDGEDERNDADVPDDDVPDDGGIDADDDGEAVYKDLSGRVHRVSGEQTGTGGDSLISGIIDFLIKELVEENAIRCNCKTSADGEYSYELCDEGITVRCAVCGAERTFPITSVSAADDWINTPELDIR